MALIYDGRHLKRVRSIHPMVAFEKLIAALPRACEGTKRVHCVFCFILLHSASIRSSTCELRWLRPAELLKSPPQISLVSE